MSINQATYKQHLKLMGELTRLLNQTQVLPNASTINPFAFSNFTSPQPRLEYPNTRIGQLIAKAGWNTSLPKEKEIDTVMELLYVELGMSDSKIEAEETLIKQKKYFFQTLPPDLCYRLIPHWWAITSKYQKDNIRAGIIYEALVAFRDKYPQTNIHDNLGYGDTLLNDPDTLKDPGLFETARFYTLTHQISFIKRASIEHLKNDSLSLLKMVLTLNDHPFPDSNFWELLMGLVSNPQSSLNKNNPLTNFINSCEYNFRSFDEAALLWNKLQNGEFFAKVITEQGYLQSDRLRLGYLKPLLKAYRDQDLIDQFFLSDSLPNGRNAVFFNGVSFENAQNLTVNELLSRPELLSFADHANTSEAAQKKALRTAMQLLGENDYYKIGTLPHSIASCLTRIYYYHHNQFPPQFRNIQQLIHLFLEAEKEWTVKKNYPISPRVLLAIHFASANGVSLVGNNWRQKLKFALENLAQGFEHLLANEDLGQIGNDEHDKMARKILKSYGKSDDDIEYKYYFTISTPQITFPKHSAPTYIVKEKVYFGNVIDEFMAKAELNRLITPGFRMYFASKDIMPTFEWLQNEFRTLLHQDPWIREKARQALLARNISGDPTHLAHEVTAIANRYHQETSSGSWWNLVKEAIYFIPVIGSLKTIEDGLRDKDWKEVALGAVYLSLDAWGLGLSALKNELQAGSRAIGAGLASSRIAAPERMAIKSVTESLRRLGIPSSSLLEKKTIQVNRNPFLIKSDSNSALHIPLAMKMDEGARAGNTLFWRDPHGENRLLIYLKERNEWVPVKSQGGSFRELSLETGKPLEDKPLIHKVGDDYTAIGLKGGSKGYDFFITPLTEEELANRPTVKAVLRIMSGANDYQRKSNFRSHFRTYFTLYQKTPTSGFLLEDHCHNLYENSLTFRRIFNKFLRTARNDRGGDHVWRVIIDNTETCRADMASKTIYINPKVESSPVKYLGTIKGDEAGHAGEAFSLERASSHEILHALTGSEDFSLQGFEGSSPRLSNVENLHRGPIVYLNDKIISEVNFNRVPARLVYRKFTGVSERNIAQLRQRLVEENRYLDEKIYLPNSLEKSFTLGGEALHSRKVISRVEKIFMSLPKEKILDTQFAERFAVAFNIPNHEFRIELYSLYQHLYESSKTFARLFDSRFDSLEINSHWEYQAPGLALEAASSDFSPDHIIRIINDGNYYLAEKGFIPIRKEQRYLYKMLEILTDLPLEELDQESQLLNRSPLIQIADRILEEAGLGKTYPRRLVDATVLPSDIERQEILLKNWDFVSRISFFEDQYLKEQIFEPNRIIRCSLFNCARPNKRDTVKQSATTSPLSFFHGVDSKAPDIQKVEEDNPHAISS